MSTPTSSPNEQKPQPRGSPAHQAIGEALLAVDFYLLGSKYRFFTNSFPIPADGWLLASLAEEYNSTFDRLMDIDTDLHAAAASDGGMDWAEYRAAELAIGGMVDKWLRCCEGMFPVTEPILPAVKRLHANIREAKAMLNPKKDVGGQVAGFRNEAIAEHQSDKTVDVLEGLDT